MSAEGYSFTEIKGLCAVRMVGSLSYQESDIKWKLGLFGYEKPEDLPTNMEAIYLFLVWLRHNKFTKLYKPRKS